MQWLRVLLKTIRLAGNGRFVSLSVRSVAVLTTRNAVFSLISLKSVYTDLSYTTPAGSESIVYRDSVFYIELLLNEINAIKLMNKFERELINIFVQKTGEFV